MYKMKMKSRCFVRLVIWLQSVRDVLFNILINREFKSVGLSRRVGTAEISLNTLITPLQVMNDLERLEQQRASYSQSLHGHQPQTVRCKVSSRAKCLNCPKCFLFPKHVPQRPRLLPNTPLASVLIVPPRCFTSLITHFTTRSSFRRPRLGYRREVVEGCDGDVKGCLGI